MYTNQTAESDLDESDLSFVCFFIYCWFEWNTHIH